MKDMFKEIDIKSLLRNLINSIVSIQKKIDTQNIEKLQELINYRQNAYTKINSYILEKYNPQTIESFDFVFLKKYRISELIVNINEPIIHIINENTLMSFLKVFKNKKLYKNIQSAQIRLNFEQEMTGILFINGIEVSRLSVFTN